MSEHSEKIESAFVAVLEGETWPADFDTALILPGESDDDKDGQCVLCVADDSDQEDPPNSGNKWNTVRIELRTPIQKKTATVDELAAHKAAAAVLETICLADDLHSQLSAAVSDFTVFGVMERLPLREQTPNFWSSGYTMRVYSCSADLLP